jgi:protein-S-isoprenylcysteine O-methyltransferase Ste14
MEKPTNSNESTTPGSSILWKAVIRFFILSVFMLGTLFLAAGRWDWWEAWAYALTGIALLIGGRTLMILKNPDTAIERAEAGKRENVQSWDRILMPFTAIYGPMLSWIVAGLDERFGWSPDLPDWIQILALIVISAGSLVGTWAMIVNRFFSSHVRIQEDRGHQVVDQGPYRFVRHPGYAGGLASWIAAPIFFSSYWVGIPCVLAIIAVFIRTALEDQLLLKQLAGYREYAQRVRYRLIPGIW